MEIKHIKETSIDWFTLQETRKHIPPKGKFGKSSTQTCISNGICDRSQEGVCCWKKGMCSWISLLALTNTFWDIYRCAVIFVWHATITQWSLFFGPNFRDGFTSSQVRINPETKHSTSPRGSGSRFEASRFFFLLFFTTWAQWKNLLTGWDGQGPYQLVQGFVQQALIMGALESEV